MWLRLRLPFERATPLFVHSRPDPTQQEFESENGGARSQGQGENPALVSGAYFCMVLGSTHHSVFDVNQMWATRRDGALSEQFGPFQSLTRATKPIEMVGKTKTKTKKPRRAERRSQSGSRRLKRKREQREFRGTALTRRESTRRALPPPARAIPVAGRIGGRVFGGDRTAGIGGGRAWGMGKDWALLLYWTRPLLCSGARPPRLLRSPSVRPSVVSSLVVLVSKAGVLSPSLLAGALIMLGGRGLTPDAVFQLAAWRRFLGAGLGPGWAGSPAPGFLCYDSSPYQSMSFRHQIKKIDERRRGRTSSDMSFARAGHWFR